MNNIKPMLWAILFSIVIILWFKWDAANAPKIVYSQSKVENIENKSSDFPGNNSINTAINNDKIVPGSTLKIQNSGKLIKVKTDVLELLIDTVGGKIVESKLIKYHESVNNKKPIKLFNSETDKLFQLESGINSNYAQNATHEAVFSTYKSNYEMTGASISVPLVWSKDGITVTKTFIFYKGRYDFAINQRVDNKSANTWSGYQYRQLKRAEVIIKRGLTTFNTFAGAAYSTPDKKYDKLKFSDMASENLNINNVKGGWLAMIQHYFMGAIIPKQNDKSTFYTNHIDNNYIIGSYGQTKKIPAGGSLVFNTTGFVGPKIKDNLASIAPNLDKATDYGWLFFISEFLFNVLNWVHSVIGNWGWAIVIVTLMIKTILFPLAAKSFKSMAKMRKFQPEIERIRKNYSEDRQLLGKKMMELYKKEGINPASGCLPILVQFPILLAFYYMLMESVELRQADWIFWITDLSLKDPIYILPIINMGLMFAQQKLNPPPNDPIQRRVMMFLPLVFGFLFLFFPSGLVLYWAVSNLFSIIQQYIITKRYGGLSHPLTHEEEKN